MTREAFKRLLEEILQVNPGTLQDADTRECVENWSSLADVEILTVVSAEFGVDAEQIEYNTVGELLSLLDERQAFAA
jgi:acyl carrier protein